MDDHLWSRWTYCWGNTIAINPAFEYQVELTPNPIGTWGIPCFRYRSRPIPKAPKALKGGAKWAAFAIAIGAALSFLTSPAAIALASAVSFALAELADMGVYSRLRRAGRHWAVAGSGVVGAVIDSVLFVWIAFGALELAAGTALAKVYASALVALVLWAVARRRAVA